MTAANQNLSPPIESPTIAHLLDEASGLLGESSRTPRLDAEVLLASTLGRTRTQLLTWSDRAVEADDAARFRRFLTRRVAREPVAYIVGKRAFWDFTVEVTPDVLIPRAETEVLVSAALEWLKGRPTARVLDLGTGSGIIAIAVARHFPSATVTATDVSPAALAVARRNAAANNAERIEFHCGNLYDAVGRQPFDLVLSNPPYVAAQEYRSLEPNVRDYEPSLALLGGEDGLDVIRAACDGIGRVLRPDGAFGLEIGARQGTAVTALMRAGGFENVRVLNDLAGHDRVVWGNRHIGH